MAEVGRLRSEVMIGEQDRGSTIRFNAAPLSGFRNISIDMYKTHPVCSASAKTLGCVGVMVWTCRPARDWNNI